MPTPPSPERLAELSERYGFGLRADELDEYAALAEATLASYSAVDEMPEQERPLKHARGDFTWPTQDDNPYGAWYLRTSISGTPGGPLEGRTIAIKDNVAVAGLPMMDGSAILEGYVPDEDATTVVRLLDAGAEIVGKAVCEDLCFSGGSHTCATGPVRNPWDPSRTTGGSSCGNGALLAAGEVDLALGGDQGGSVRMPAAFCGFVGLKATWGLVPYTGAVPIESTIDHLGPMARNVRDTALMLQAIAGPDPDDPRQDSSIRVPDYLERLDEGVDGWRVAIVSEGFGWPDLSEDGVDRAVRAAASRFAELGAEVIEVSIPAHRDAIHIWNVIAIEGATTQLIDLHGSGMNYKGRYAPRLIEALQSGRRERGARLSPSVKLTALVGAAMIEDHGGAYYARARNLLPSLSAAYDDSLAIADLLVMPTLPMVAPPLPAPDAPISERVARALEMIVNTAPFDITGHPAISIPAGLVDGLPAGMMLVGRQFEDATVLRAAQAFESLVGGFPSPATREVVG